MKKLNVQMYITDNCDQRCRHCYIFGADPNRTPNTMTFENFKDAVNRCIEYSEREDIKIYWGITGGDPILHPQFWDFMKFMRDNDLNFVMIGNPFHMTEEIFRKLKEYGCTQFQMSLDGLRENHDKNRKPGSFDSTLSRFKMIHNAGLESGVRTIVSDKNISDIPKLIDLCVEYKVGDFAFSRYAPNGGNKNKISPLEYRNLLDTCYKKFEAYRKKGCWTYFYEAEHLFTLYKYEEGIITLPENFNYEIRKTIGGCSCGIRLKKMRILWDGTVMACRRNEDSVLGNIFRDSIDDIQKSKSCYSDINLYEGCRECKLASWCRGCPAVSYGQYGNFFARDPQCWNIIKK